MSDNSRLIVAPARGQSLILVIIIVIIIIVVLIILILRIRKATTTSGTTTGSGSTECVNDVDCSGTQVCNTSRGVCVDCVSPENCPVQAPICDSSNNKCVGCLASTDCPINKPQCDTVTKQCVQCTQSSQCGGASPICNPATRTCVGCLSAGDCSGITSLCNPGTNSCVQCISNVQCTAPATCVGGLCCNTTAPSITGISASQAPGGSPQINVTYSFSQPSGGTTTAVFEVSDPTGFVIYQTPGTTATGSYSIVEPQLNVPPRFYSFYTYQVRVRISQPCGATAFSGYAAITMPYIPGSLFPVIDSVGGNTTGFTVTTTQPDDTQLCIFYQPTIWVIPEGLGSNYDLNRAASQESTFCQTVGHKESFSGLWPFPVATGQKYWIVMTGQEGTDWVTPSSPVLFTIP